MRRPIHPERLYLDFDGFFASVEQQARPSLRGRPIGVVPFAGTQHTCIIACSKEAKSLGVENIMPVKEALEKCSDLILVPQSPDLYRRAHNALLSEISAVIPLDAVKSIDEITCRLEPSYFADPERLGRKIKERIKEHIGPYITCSIGFAANRQLAKMACKAGKRLPDKPYGDGNNVWWPHNMPQPLHLLSLKDIPGVGNRLEKRLWRAGIFSTEDLLKTAPKQMRALWGNVTGERLWYALHGYEIQAEPQARGMYGHGRVLPPNYRSITDAKAASRLLLTKAARRMRRDGFLTNRLWLWLSFRDGSWFADRWLPSVKDDQAVLEGLEALWAKAESELPAKIAIIRLGVTLLELTQSNERQLDLLLNDDRTRLRWEAATSAIDALNYRYGRTLVSLGTWTPPLGGYAGGKISYTRIPSAQDFW